MSLSVFINYRRRDTSESAGRLADRALDRYGKNHVFMDVDSIKPGTDYVTAINNAIARSDVMLVVIGDEWLDARDSQGVRRLDKPTDRVRLEIESAMLKGLPILPVVVDSAFMPTSEDLPAALEPLSRYHALRVRHDSFSSDAQRVLEAADEFGTRSSPFRWLTVALLLATAAALVAMTSGMLDPLSSSRPNLPRTDDWLTFVWLLPLAPVLVAALILLVRPISGVAVGLVASALVWMWETAVHVWMADDLSTGQTQVFVLLVLLLLALVAAVAATPQVLSPIRAVRGPTLVAVVALLVAAVALRVQSPVSNGDFQNRPAFWVGWSVPLLVGLGALVRGSATLARAVVTLALTEAAYVWLLQVLRWQGKGEPGSADAIFAAGTLCMLVAVLASQVPRLRTGAATD